MGRYLLWLVAVFSAMLMASAQESPQKPTTPQQEKADLERLLLALAEINWFYNVQPLKLSSEQVAKLIEANKKAFSRLEELFQTEAKELKAQREEILRVREEAAKGKPVPKEFIDKIKELEKKAIKRRQELRLEVVRGIGKELKPIFTEEQLQYMVKRGKEVLTEMKFSTEGIKEDQLYWFFVENVFLTEQASTLLKELQKSE